MANKGNIGLLFKQVGTVVSGTTSYDIQFGGFFSSTLSFGNNPNGKPFKFYNPQTGLYGYFNVTINGTNSALPTQAQLPLTAGTYEIWTYYPNPLEIVARSSAGRGQWFDLENWEIVKRFKNLEVWADAGQARFSFSDINFNNNTKLKVFQFVEARTPSNAKITLSSNLALEDLLLVSNSNRDYIFPDFQVINLKTINIQNRTVEFTTNPSPFLNFSNKTSLTSVTLTGSTRFSGLNITGCTNLITLLLRNMSVVNTTWLSGLSSCINIQNLQFGGTGVTYGGTPDLSVYPNLVTVDLSSAGLTNVSFPVQMPSSCSYIDFSSNDVTNNWINNLRTNRPTGLSLTLILNKTNRGSVVPNYSVIIPHTLTNASIVGSNSNYTVSEINKILYDLDQNWISGGTVDFRNQDAPDNFSGGFNGEAAFISLKAKGATFPIGSSFNNYPSYREYTIVTTAPNTVYTFDKGLPTVNKENSIDWGDGTQETFTSSSPSTTKSHNYVAAGTYVIRSWYSDDTITQEGVTEIVICVNSGNVSGVSNLTSFTTLKYVKNVGQTTNTTRNLASVSFVNNPNFTTFQLPDIVVGVTMIANATPSLSTLDFTGNALTTSSIEILLVSLNNNTTSSATIRYIKLEGGTNASKATWTSNANTAYNSLLTKNFTITFNP